MGCGVHCQHLVPGDGVRQNCPNIATSAVTVRYQLTPEGRVHESTCFECDEHRGAFVASDPRITEVSTQVF